MKRAPVRVVRLCPRRRLRAAAAMRRAGWPVHAIARALGLKPLSVAHATRWVSGAGALWTPAEAALFRRAA